MLKIMTVTSIGPGAPARSRRTSHSLAAASNDNLSCRWAGLSRSSMRFGEAVYTIHPKSLREFELITSHIECLTASAVGCNGIHALSY
jgi:hypothetical protein